MRDDDSPLAARPDRPGKRIIMRTTMLGTTMYASRPLPPVPEIGHAEGFYARKVHEAERLGDDHAREANKVAQYITLATNPHLEWEQKLRYFQHALRRHAQAPPLATEVVWMFYAQLADLVRQYAGQEALKVASVEDDRYASLQRSGVPRKRIEDDADVFFARLVGNRNERPDYLNEEDWNQLKMLRDQWI
jgi:hypothetical protein